jgi:hypothetical protein
VKFSVHASIHLNSKECSPLGVNEGVNIQPRGQISPLGAKFTTKGEVHPWEPGVKLRMALSFIVSVFESNHANHSEKGSNVELLNVAQTRQPAFSRNGERPGTKMNLLKKNVACPKL